MANWVEEIRSISFSHVFHECNMVADALAKDGASRASLLFDA